MSRSRAPAVLIWLALCSCEPDYPVSTSTGRGSLREALNESERILSGTLSLTDRKALTAGVRNVRILKGTSPPPGFRLTFGTCDQAKALKRHVVDGAPVILFQTPGLSFVYLNRVFIPMYPAGSTNELQAGILEGQWNHVYNGSVTDLAALAEKVLKGEAKPPPMNPNVPPIDAASLHSLPDWDMHATEEDLPPPFKKTPLPPAVTLAAEHPASVEPGLNVEVYEGSWGGLPTFADLVPAEKRVAEGPIPLEFKKGGRGALRYRGYLEVPRDGGYSFSSALAQHCSVRLLIGDKVVDCTGVVPDEVLLDGGKHAVTMEYSGESGPGGFTLFWSGPGFTKQPVPAKSCSR